MIMRVIIGVLSGDVRMRTHGKSSKHGIHRAEKNQCQRTTATAPDPRPETDDQALLDTPATFEENPF